MQNILMLMATDRLNEAPSNNTVGFNRYFSESDSRVRTGSVREDWYIARLMIPGREVEMVNKYAADIVMRVVQVKSLPNGAVSIYAMPAHLDGGEKVEDEDAVPMDWDGYLTDEGKELGYLLDVFMKSPRGLGALAAEAALEA